ncbi:siderophore-interacting protein [Bosea rubneri]|uniref:Siderophore-interacting protein n=1 Tax=Bosea rubneri TaxID=3075434 RepID=A0ABU3S5D3_9HYPH|nr:siderophore-interacting protein [Bosea sp. ZW T0_25]MDU0339982.1 siderophore-interacting protein [Bosea sp. ZW T0_25]
MTILCAEARFSLADPDALLRALREHLVEHHATVSERDGATLIALDGSEAALRLMAGELLARVEAPSLAGLQAMKLAIASHVVELAPAGSAPAISWQGDGSGPSLLPDFRILTVTGTERLTPHMRRIRFRGEDLARFDSLEALHVRLFIPPAGLAEPIWPMVGEDGLVNQPPAEQRPAVRKYTIREIDAAAGTLAIDFVLHGDVGPGSAFAERAAAGDRIGMAGPGGRGLREAERYLFLADETGLPAVARMLANLPGDAQGLALIEVADAQEQQALEAPAGVTIRWLHRDRAKADAAPQLLEEFEALDWEQDGPGTYVWAAMEHDTFRLLRAAARQRLRPNLDQHLIVSYWRNGLSEEQHALEKKAAARAA